MEQIELNLGVPIDESKLGPNAMMNLNGYGPEGKRCKHLFAWKYAGTYYKCGQRQNTNSAATDQRVNWKACSKFIER
ncbi:hypothetical protein [Lysinibacillus pakistanensis]|uniref:Uncharacterized protein n=1 Tax=Lysinibacillus pakistanensis TaxID=759811 RepID=A0ABX6DA69_9BACI|nr:hypothetical protein GDS87_11090 [Lysinibacillus pakistanensis]